jgi:hypothetical protein
MLGTKALPMRDSSTISSISSSGGRRAARTGGRTVAPQLHPMLEAAPRSRRSTISPCTPTPTRRGQAPVARERSPSTTLADHLYEEHRPAQARLNIVHSVWISRAEMDQMAQADAGIVLNHSAT